MVISDLFSTSFLFSIAIIILLIGSIFAYISYRIGEQDHKLTSMVNLVSILAQDLQFVKSKVSMLQHTKDNNINLQYPTDMIGQGTTELISVSDDENDEERDEDDECDENEECDEDDEDDDCDDCDEYSDEYSDEDSDEDGDDGEQVEDTKERIKLLNLSLANDDIENDFHIEELNTSFEEINTKIEELNTGFEEINISYSTDNIKTIHIENTITFEESENPMYSEIEQTDTKITSEDNLFFKNLTITDLGDIDDSNASKNEYKKMSLNKLREVIISKGIISDASKLKKNEIIKMLGDE